MASFLQNYLSLPGFARGLRIPYSWQRRAGESGIRSRSAPRCSGSLSSSGDHRAASCRGSACPARCCTSSKGTFCSRRSVTVATRKEWGENWPGSPAALSRRFIMRQMSIPLIALAVSFLVRRNAGAEEGALADPGGLDITQQDLLEVMPDGDLPRLTAFLGEPQGVLRAVVLQALEGQPGHSTHAGGGVDQHGDDSPVPEADEVRGVDRLQEVPGLLGADLWCLALDTE